MCWTKVGRQPACVIRPIWVAASCAQNKPHLRDEAHLYHAAGAGHHMVLQGAAVAARVASAARVAGCSKSGGLQQERLVVSGPLVATAALLVGETEQTCAAAAWSCKGQRAVGTPLLLLTPHNPFGCARSTHSHGLWRSPQCRASSHDPQAQCRAFSHDPQAQCRASAHAQCRASARKGKGRASCSPLRP